MIEMREMTNFEMDDVLRRVCYGHLGCADGNRPYVVPVHYAYEKPRLYICSGEGKKTDILKSNPEVCVQVEDVDPNGSWQSIVVNGRAKLVADPAEKARILKLVVTDPALSPAMGITWKNGRISSKACVVFEITAETITGRSADKVKICAASAQPAGRRRSYVF